MPDSAVAAFWKTFSPERGGPPRVLRRRTSNNLPTELLFIIFRLVYEQEINERGRFTEFDLRSPSLFPHAIAAVCLLWRDVMALIPEFWTRVVILTDLTPTSEILSHISWSGNLPLEITIMTKNFDPGMVDVQHERTQVLSIMTTVINPWLDRVRDLKLKVKFSSSLPPIPALPANSLRRLHLGCKEDNGISSGDWQSVPPTCSEPQFSSIRSLFLDGRNYYITCKTAFWQETAMPVCLKVLSIHNYTPPPGESFALSDFLLPISTGTLKALHLLQIHNVALVLSPSPLPTILHPPGVYELQLSHIRPFEIIAEILRWSLRTAHKVLLKRCAIGDPGILFGRPERYSRLTLIDIDADQDLIPLLRRWQGHDLCIRNCASFNDAALDMMAFDGLTFRSLKIGNCDNFSGASLRRFVEDRRLAGHGFFGLEIFGRAPEISDEDQEWLSQSVDRFSYRPSHGSSSK